MYVYYVDSRLSHFMTNEYCVRIGSRAVIDLFGVNSQQVLQVESDWRGIPPRYLASKRHSDLALIVRVASRLWLSTFRCSSTLALHPPSLTCFRTGGRRRPGSDSSRRGLVVVCLCDLEA